MADLYCFFTNNQTKKATEENSCGLKLRRLYLIEIKRKFISDLKSFQFVLKHQLNGF